MFYAKSTLLKLQSASFKPLQQIRLKRDKAGLNPQLQRVVTQLSVMSAARKQPRLLKLCNEDYIKHRTIMKAWSKMRKQKIHNQEEILKRQYESIVLASEDLKNISPKLFENANTHQHGKRFPLELRVPTEFPPRQIWYYEYFPKANSKQ